MSVILEKNNELPIGWTESNLDSLSLVITKGSTPTTYGFPYQKTGINFIKVENIIDGWIDQKTIHEFISQDANDYLKRSQLEENDILFSIAGTIGRTTIIRKIDLPANTNQAVAIIRCPWKHLNPKYVRLILDSPILFNSFSRKSRGVGIYNLSLSDIKELIIPIPPLNEQKRIVAKIEELFSKIHMIDNLLKILLIQLNNQRESILTSKFQICLENNPSDKLDELTASRKIGLDRSRINQFKDGTPYLKMNNITIDGKLDLNSIVYVKVEKNEFSNFSLQKNDVLFNTRNSYELVGKTTIWDDKIPNCVYNNNIMRIRVKPIIEPKFLAYFMNSKHFKNNLFSIKRATTNICAIYDKDLKNQLIPVPPINEQKIIISEIEFNLSLIENSKTLINFLLEKISSLKSSILKKAFEGKLVLQDPNDEPAEILLEKIKQEKEQLIQKQKTSRSRKNDK